MADKRKAPQRLEVLHPDCAGIDIGKTSHYVAVDGARFDEPVRKFGTFTADLEAMAEWLDSCGVREVAMESTGVYWIPAFEVLDRAGLDVRLVNARATKQVSGRKSDVMDCQWIRQLMSHGLLSGAFRVPDEVCAMRSYLRQRDGLVGQRSRAVLHIHKALTQMNVQLDNVLSDVMGKTGQLIVRAIVAGERDGARLAGFRDGRCKAEEATIAASLQGNWRDEHLFALAQALERHDALQGQVEACEARINAELDALARPGLPDPPAPEADAGGRPGGHPDHRRGDGADRRRRGRGRPVAVPFGGALLLLAGARAGDAHQRRQAPQGRAAPPLEPARAGPAHGGDDRAPGQKRHRRHAPPPAGANGHGQGRQGHRPPARAAHPRHAHPRRGVRRTRHRRVGGQAPRAHGPQPPAAGQAPRPRPRARHLTALANQSP